MRLLYVIDSVGRGGAETSLAEMAPGLSAAGIDLHVLPFDRERRHQVARLETAGATIHFPSAKPGRLRNVRTVLEVARRVRPDLIHTTLFEADVAGRIAARLLNVPVTSSIVNDSYSPSHYRESSTLKLHAARALDGATSLFVRRFHSITQAIARGVAPRLGIPLRKIEVIPRGRDPQLYPFRDSEARARARSELGIPSECPLVLAVGRHEPQKGLQHLLRALPTLAPAHPGLVVIVAGRDGRSTPELRALASRTNVEVRFLGHREDVPDLLACADVFCFPSEREGFGGVLIEAMATGCPVVASSIPTTQEVLGPGASSVGLLTPVGDVAALSQAIDNLLTHPDDALALAVQARQRFEDNFTIHTVAERMSRFFTEASGLVRPAS